MQKSNLCHIIVKQKIMMAPPHKTDIRQVLDMNRLDTFHLFVCLLFVCLFVCLLVGFINYFVSLPYVGTRKHWLKLSTLDLMSAFIRHFVQKAFLFVGKMTCIEFQTFFALCLKMKACLIKQSIPPIFLNARL
jgi:hypothetical protein